MTPAGFPESNGVLHPPVGMTAEECEPLQVWRGPVPTPTGPKPAVISCYKLTAEEINHLLGGGRLWLYVMGETMPPVALSTAHPWGPQ